MTQHSSQSDSDDAPKPAQRAAILGKKWHSLTLSDTEKTNIRSKAIAQGMHISRTEVSAGRFLSFSHLHAKALVLGVCGVVFIGGGVSLAAEKALPGEIMYPIKTILNDSIIELTALTNVADMQAKVIIIERRSYEIEELVQTHALSDEAVEIITDNIKHHVYEALLADRTPESTNVLTEDLSNALDESVVLLEEAEASVRGISHLTTTIDLRDTATSSIATSSSADAIALRNTTATEEIEILEALDDAQESIEMLTETLEAVDIQ